MRDDSVIRLPMTRLGLQPHLEHSENQISGENMPPVSHFAPVSSCPINRGCSRWFLTGPQRLARVPIFPCSLGFERDRPIHSTESDFYQHSKVGRGDIVCLSKVGNRLSNRYIQGFHRLSQMRRHCGRSRSSISCEGPAG